MDKNNYWLNDDGLLLVSAWRRDGMSLEQIAHKIGIAPGTLIRWERRNRKFKTAMNANADHIDAMVENAILKKALGFMSQEEKRVVKADGQEEVTTVTKEIPPDVSAASVWLKNRRPDRWRDKPSENGDSLKDKLEEILGGIDAQVD